jgi:PAS domain S-box-containing protein
MRPPLRVLSIEDEPKDADLIKNLLETEGIVCDITRVENQADFLTSLKRGGIDLILADYSLPSFDGISALKLAMKGCPDVPFIFVSGTLGEEVAVEALKIGATDYVLKTSLSRLAPSVERALREGTQKAERKRAEEALRKSEAYLAAAQRLSLTGSFGWNLSSGEIYWSEETYKIFEYDRAAKPTLELVFRRIHPDDRDRMQQTIDRASEARADLDFEHRLMMSDASVKYLHVLARALETSSGDLEYVGAVMDITAAKRAEETLRQSEAYLSEAQRLSQTGSWAWAPATGEIRYCSEECYRVLGFDPQGGQARFETFFERIHPDDRPTVAKTLERATRERAEFELDDRIVYPGGEIRDVHVVGHPVLSPSGDLVEFVGTVMDVTERKRAEESLRRSEGYLADAQRLSHTGSWASKPASGENTYWSEECYRLMGFDPQGGLPGFETVLQRYHPDDQVRIREAVERAERGKSDFELDYRIVHPGGEIRDIHVVGHPVLSPSGDFVEFVGTVMDITERKRAEERTRLIIDTVPAQLWTESPDGVVDFVNRRWIDYTGMTLEQAVGSGWNRMVHPDDIERVLSKWRILVSEGKPREIESRLRRFDGEYRWFLSRCCPLVDRSGNILGWYGSDTDIHDRKEAEERLRQSEAHLQEAQTLGRVGSWVFNIAAETVSGSPELFRIFGRDPGDEQLTKEMISDVRSMPIFRASVHPEDLPFVEEFTNKTRSEGKVGGELEYRIVLRDGSVKYVHSVAHPVLDASGNVVQYIGTIMDVTERNRAEEALRQAQADLAHVNRVTTMGELTASVAHEVNQPIAAAVTNANTCLRWLARDQPDLEEARAAAMRIVNDGTRAAEIIKRIRLLFKKGASEREMVDINEVVEELVVLLRGEVTRYSILVQTELEANTPRVIADRVQLQQVLMNLMINGIDAMKNVTGTRELAIKSQHAETGQVLVSVNDTGMGLPAQQSDKVFEAFFTTKPNGMGMGLSISRSIVESHGGRLWAAPNSPRGASFCFTLPANAQARE